MIIAVVIVLDQVPPRVSPPPRDKRVPSRVGGLPKAGGPVEMAHLAFKQTDNVRLLVL